MAEYDPVSSSTDSDVDVFLCYRQIFDSYTELRDNSHLIELRINGFIEYPPHILARIVSQLFKARQIVEEIIAELDEFDQHHSAEQNS